MDRLVDALAPEMPPAARAKITSQAQGIPLFAAETVRSLIDRDIVQPVEGVYRLTGDIGELSVPDSLHALLSLRERSTPYHLAPGLLDHAQFLLRQDDDGAAASAVEEARDIAERLHCQPLLDRAAVPLAAGLKLHHGRILV
jgi:hypothetical protein